MEKSKKERGGVSLRVIHSWLIVIAVIVSAIMIISTIHLTSAFLHVTNATEDHIALEKAAHELMDASDYLTESVQRFTAKGDIRFLNNYFTEAFESKRREDAIEKMDVDENTADALRHLQNAMNNSLALMEREYYAMRLVIEAKGYTDYPELLDSVVLSPGDAALSSDAKMRRATEIVLDDEYYLQKNRIRADMQESLREIEELTHKIDAEELKSLNGDLTLVRVIILVQTFAILFMVWLTAHLGINPVLRAVDRIKADSPIPETGANEFRYLAKAYNKMYAVYKASLERLNFKASHDELTGAYNRAGYDILLTGIDLNTTYMLLFDVDNFKNINDTHGHEIGDRVLIKLVQTLKSSFRGDDYVCRIGGDEFVVLMTHSDAAQHKLIANKIKGINRELGVPEDGMPSISVSVGIAHGSDAVDASDLFEKTDAAMYISKKQGKHTYTFYSK